MTKEVIITHLLKAVWGKVCYNINVLKHYFTNNWCGITSYGEDDSLICPQNFSDGKHGFYQFPDQPIIPNI